ncbi:unnamed protein product [Fusarium graminearum]|nr:unnamed protein product [Fusarium graminearum]
MDGRKAAQSLKHLPRPAMVSITFDNKRYTALSMIWQNAEFIYILELTFPATPSSQAVIRNGQSSCVSSGSTAVASHLRERYLRQALVNMN